MFALILFCCVLSVANCANMNSSLSSKVRIRRIFDEECGVATDTSGLFSDAQDNKREDYPWLVAIWLREENKKPKYLCCGNLISARKVVTAANCLQEEGQKNLRKPDDLMLSLGAFNLSDSSEPDRVEVVPSNVRIHWDWNPFVERFNDDIAVITLEDDIKFTRFIRPICLLRRNVDHQVSEGIVVGWGASEDTTKIHENIPRLLQIPIVRLRAECYEEIYVYATIGSKNSFCAGQPGVGVCLGDSGSGFIVKISNRFYLKGIFSSSLIDPSGGYTESYAIYTDVPKYLDWIENTKPKAIKACGVMSSSTSLVVGGEFSTREQFPWVVQVFLSTYKGYIWRGAGSLISDRHVVSTADSVSYIAQKTILLEPFEIKRLKLIFGSTQSDSSDEPGAVVKTGETDIGTINVHPFAKFDFPIISNIAVITLKNPIIFSRYISPVCLWEFDSKIDEIVGKTAFGVGYGFDQNDELTGARKHVPMIIDNQKRCKEFYEEYEIIIGNKSEYFCASGRSGNVVNFYDNPLYIKFNDIWFLRGLKNLGWNFDAHIYFERPLLYGNIAIYAKWIQDQM